jgi:hypothetical protein
MTRASAAGTALILPALAFVLSALLYAAGLPTGPSGQLLVRDLNEMGAFRLLSPLVFLGGSLTALALGVASQVDVSLQAKRGAVHATLRGRPQLVAMLLCAVSVLVLLVLGSYVVAENWQCLTGPNCLTHVQD